MVVNKGLTDNEVKLKKGLLLAIGLIVILSVVLIFNMVQASNCEAVESGAYMLQSDCDFVITEICGDVIDFDGVLLLNITDGTT